jgi:high-affinity Fe2+/Pb2+ permease
MYKRLNELNFVIGLFFSLVSAILLLGYLFSKALSQKINLFTGLTFLVFGLFMIAIRRRDEKD